jgi:hypothetical protein
MRRGAPAPACRAYRRPIDSEAFQSVSLSALLGSGAHKLVVCSHLNIIITKLAPASLLKECSYSSRMICIWPNMKCRRRESRPWNVHLACSFSMTRSYYQIECLGTARRACPKDVLAIHSLFLQFCIMRVQVTHPRTPPPRLHQP